MSRFGPTPLPRRFLNPAFYVAVRASGHRQNDLALLAGVSPGNRISVLLRAESVTDTSLNIERLEKLADLIGFDKSRLFVDGAQ